MAMSWGGVIGSALAGGVGAAAEAGANQIIEQQKAEAQRLRDEQLAKLTERTQINVHAAQTAAETAAIGPRADAASQAALRNVGAETQRQSALADAKLADEQRNAKAQNELTAGKITSSAEATAKGQQVADKYIESTRTPEQAAKAKAALDKAQADIRKANAEAAQAGAHAGYFAEATKGVNAKAGAKTDKAAEPHWVTDKNTGVVSEEKTGIIRTMVPAVKGVEAKRGILGTGVGEVTGRAAIPAHAEYTASDGTPITAKEYQDAFAKAFRTIDTESLPSAGSAATATSAPGAVDAAGLAAKAKAAIAQGAPESEVKALYKQRTGKDLL